MQGGCVEVVNVDGVANDVVAVVVGFAVYMATSDSATGHPHGITATVVIATVVVPQPTLSVDSASEFFSPDDERIVQHAPLFQVCNECRLWLANGGSDETIVLTPAAYNRSPSSIRK